MSNFSAAELIRLEQQQSLTTLAGSVLAVCCLGAAICLPKQYRGIPLIASLPACYVAKTASDRRSRTSYELALQETAHNVNRHYAVYTGEPVKDGSLKTLPIRKPSKRFRWQDLEDKPDLFPHILVLGNTGSGKTTLAEYMGQKMSDGQRYAIAPHLKPGDWTGFDQVWGGGRNFGTADDPDVLWSDIASGLVPNPTVAQVLAALLQEMDDRYRLLDKGLPLGDFINVYIDEIPAIASAVRPAMDAIAKLIMEARKVGIRLWLLAQGDTVNLLGLEGKSQLKESLTYVRLGRFAKAAAFVLSKEGLLSAEDGRYIQDLERPCLIDEAVAVLPSYETMMAARQPQDFLGYAISCLEKGQDRTAVLTALGYTGDRYPEGLALWQKHNLPDSWKP